MLAGQRRAVARARPRAPTRPPRGKPVAWRRKQGFKQRLDLSVGDGHPAGALLVCRVRLRFQYGRCDRVGARADWGSSAASGPASLGLVPVASVSGTSNRVATDSPGRLRRSGAGREGRRGAVRLDFTGLLAAAGVDRMGSVHQDGSCGGASLRSESAGTAPGARTMTGTTTSAGDAPPWYPDYSGPYRRFSSTASTAVPSCSSTRRPLTSTSPSPEAWSRPGNGCSTSQDAVAACPGDARQCARGR